MGIVFGVVAPVFIIIALGALAAHRRIIDEAGFRGINDFTFMLAVPSLLFSAATSDNASGGHTAIAFFLAALLVYAAALGIGLRHLRMGLGEAGLFALNCGFGNTTMMGVPLIIAAFGQEGLAVLVAILALHAMVLLSLTTVIAEIGLHRHAPWKRVAWATMMGVVRNPIVATIIVALAWRAIGLPVPGVMRQTLGMFGAAAPAVALFCLGGSLIGFRPSGAMGEVLYGVLLKLLALPLTVWAMALLIGLSPLETAVAVVSGALPTGANAFMLARRYSVGAARSGGIVLLSTLASVVTLTVVLGWFAP